MIQPSIHALQVAEPFYTRSGLCITDFKDEDVRMNSKRCKLQPTTIEAFLKNLAREVSKYIEQTNNKNIIVCCRKGQNRSAALVALVYSELLHVSVSQAVEEMQQKLSLHKEQGHRGPCEFFSSSGGQFFQWLIEKGHETPRAKHNKKQNKETGKASAGYDCERDSFCMKLYTLGEKHACLHIGNAISTAHNNMDFVVDLSGELRNESNFQCTTMSAWT